MRERKQLERIEHTSELENQEIERIEERAASVPSKDIKNMV